MSTHRVGARIDLHLPSVGPEGARFRPTMALIELDGWPVDGAPEVAIPAGWVRLILAKLERQRTEEEAP